MSKHSMAAAYLIAAVVIIATGMQCATVSSTTSGPSQSATIDRSFPAYDGPKTRIQVIRFGVPQEVAKKYPELGQRRVGWGLANRIVDILYETKRFEFVEEKEKVLDKMFRTWKLSMSGAVSDSTAVEPGALNAPEYLLYAEVFDFSVGNRESVTGVAVKSEDITRIGIQLRLVDVETGEYIPASGTGMVTVTKNATVWAADLESFDQSTVGQASELALYDAIHTLLRRME